MPSMQLHTVLTIPRKKRSTKKWLCSCIIIIIIIHLRKRKKKIVIVNIVVFFRTSETIAVISFIQFGTHRSSLSITQPCDHPRSHSLWLCSSNHLLKLRHSGCFVFTFTGVQAIDRDDRYIMYCRIYMKMCNVMERRIDRVGVCKHRRARARQREWDTSAV